MTHTFEDRYRAMLEAEGGEPVSAGARLSHVRAGRESGRALYVDLSLIPEDKREALASHINNLVALFTASKPDDPRKRGDSVQVVAG